MRKISILQEDITILNVYVPNNKCQTTRGKNRTQGKNKSIKP